jgi:hypothetical protein
MRGCTGLTSVQFPDKVTGSIYMQGCTGLTSVQFPDKVTGYIDMRGCTGLTSVQFPKETGYIDMRGCTGLTSVQFPDKVTGSIYMQGCTGLTSVQFPDKVTDSIYMRGCTGLTSVQFPDKVTGYIDMRGCTGLTSVQFPKETGYIDMDDKSSEYLLSLNHKKIVYHINNVQFNRNLFDSVRLGQLSAQQVFAIANTEQRRVAYEKMDKGKMAELPNLKVLDESKDKYGFQQRIISFTVEGFDKPFLYYHCFCPSTGREYYIETRQITCKEAKPASFRLSEDFEFTEEW